MAEKYCLCVSVSVSLRNNVALGDIVSLRETMSAVERYCNADMQKNARTVQQSDQLVEFFCANFSEANIVIIYVFHVCEGNYCVGIITRSRFCVIYKIDQNHLLLKC